MIGLLGYNFCADKNAVDPMPTNAAKLSIVQIEGGIFDHINITSKTDGQYSEIPPTTWDFSTILDCDFADNISGGNIGDISKDTTLVSSGVLRVHINGRPLRKCRLPKMRICHLHLLIIST